MVDDQMGSVNLKRKVKTVLKIQDLRGGGVWGGEASPRSLFSRSLRRLRRRNEREIKEFWRVADPPNLPAGDDRVSPVKIQPKRAGSIGEDLKVAGEKYFGREF